MSELFSRWLFENVWDVFGKLSNELKYDILYDVSKPFFSNLTERINSFLFLFWRLLILSFRAHKPIKFQLNDRYLLSCMFLLRLCIFFVVLNMLCYCPLNMLLLLLYPKRGQWALKVVFIIFIRLFRRLWRLFELTKCWVHPSVGCTDFSVLTWELVIVKLVAFVLYQWSC